MEETAECLWLGSRWERFTRRAHCLRREIDVPRQVLGSHYGSHCVATEGLGPDAVVYSFGVGEDISFDLEMIERWGVTVHAFDPTPRVREFLAAQQPPAAFRMHYWGLAASDGERTFRPPENDAHISHTLLERPATDGRSIQVPFRRLATVMRELGHPRVDVLKMDIEGAEYEVIDDLIASRVEVAQVLVEFHHKLPGVGYEPTRRALRQLHSAGYRVFHYSAKGTEVSLRRDG